MVNMDSLNVFSHNIADYKNVSMMLNEELLWLYT
jgi:hypothetical protein